MILTAAIHFQWVLVRATLKDLVQVYSKQSRVPHTVSEASPFTLHMDRLSPLSDQAFCRVPLTFKLYIRSSVAIHPEYLTANCVRAHRYRQVSVSCNDRAHYLLGVLCVSRCSKPLLGSPSGSMSSNRLFRTPTSLDGYAGAGIMQTLYYPVVMVLTS